MYEKSETIATQVHQGEATNEINSHQARSLSLDAILAFEDELRLFLCNYWQAAQLSTTDTFKKNPKEGLFDTTKTVANNSINFIMALKNFVTPLASVTPVLMAQGVANLGTELLMSLPGVKTTIDKIEKKISKKTGIISDQEMLDNFLKSFTDNKDAEKTSEKIAKAIGCIYGDQIGRLSVNDARRLAKLTGSMIINYMQMGGFSPNVIYDDRVEEAIGWLFYAGLYIYGTSDKDSIVKLIDKFPTRIPSLSLRQENGKSIEVIMADFYAGPGLKCLKENQEEVFFDQRLEGKLRTRSDIWGYRWASANEAEAYGKFIQEARGNRELDMSQAKFILVSPTLGEFNENSKLSPIPLNIKDKEPMAEKISEIETKLSEEGEKILKIGEEISDLNTVTQGIRSEMDYLKQAVSDNEGFKRVLKETFKVIEKRDQEKSATISVLESQVEKQSKTISALESQVEQQNQTIADLKTTAQQLNTMVLTLQNNMTEKDREHLAMQEQFNSLANMVQLLSQQVNQKETASNMEQKVANQNTEETPIVSPASSKSAFFSKSNLENKEIKNVDQAVKKHQNLADENETLVVAT